ncbi:efflux RND transporter periplasmic adaptor subunit [Stygiobacter electus]|uniref:Efflux RND transporter periplasmic adaptor subunit n=1 Tax=Stygiobacter electus TaxID=3032292 RepID=A0AAE3NZ35_9BACT|nr:efflux RND transporter periplasmic adaptor subunit [Stygiobacter electus]MDF1611369.1 efflux RND transporter periplasmic adaptor subunit [Stygiobacter electus]
MKNTQIILLLLILLFTIVLYSCSPESQDKEKQEQMQEQTTREKAGLKPGEVILSQKQLESVGIQLGSVEQRNLTGIIKTNGFLRVAPQHKASISAFMGGVVKSIFVQVGDYVKKGQTLALLEHPDYIQLQDDYLKAQSNYNFLEKQYLRQKELYAGNATAEKTFQQTESDYNTAKAAYYSLKKKLEMIGINMEKLDKGEIISSIPIVSPISGYVQTVGVNIGKFADPMKEIFNIVDNSQIQLDLQVYEKDIFKVKTGQKIYFSFPNQKNVSGYASIFAVDKSLDDNTKSITVHAKVTSNAEKNFLPGIYVNGFIETGTTKSNALPSEAIINEGQKNYVFLLSRTINEKEGKNYIFEMRDVKVGISEAGFTEITFLEEIPKDAKIVIKGAFFLESELNKKAEGELD